DVIDRDVAAGRVHHAELEERVGAGRFRTECRLIAVADLKTSHTGLPLSTPVRRIANVTRIPLPPPPTAPTSGAKGESCFKRRPESKLNDASRIRRVKHRNADGIGSSRGR